MLPFEGLAAVVLALSAALMRPRGSDPVSIALIAAAAGLAGGVLRDLLLSAPADAVRDPVLMALALGAGGVGMALSGGARGARAVPILDAAALAILSAVGCAKAAAYAAPPLGAVLVGAVCGVTGGLLRDLLLRRAPRLLTSPFYGSAAVLGAALVMAVRLSGGGDAAAVATGAAGAFVSRMAAILTRERRARAPSINGL